MEIWAAYECHEHAVSGSTNGLLSMECFGLVQRRVVSELQLQSLNQCIWVLPHDFSIFPSYCEGWFIPGHVLGEVMGGRFVEALEGCNCMRICSRFWPCCMACVFQDSTGDAHFLRNSAQIHHRAKPFLWVGEKRKSGSVSGILRDRVCVRVGNHLLAFQKEVIYITIIHYQSSVLESPVLTTVVQGVTAVLIYTKKIACLDEL